jgi:hypothetical protein
MSLTALKGQITRLHNRILDSDDQDALFAEEAIDRVGELKTIVKNMLISEAHLKDQETLLDIEEDLLMVKLQMQALKKKSGQNTPSAEANVEPATNKKALEKLVSVMSKPKKFSTGFKYFEIFEKEIIPYLSVSEI